jgi:cell division protein FtsW (lipid II flippase)
MITITDWFVDNFAAVLTFSLSGLVISLILIVIVGVSRNRIPRWLGLLPVVFIMIALLLFYSVLMGMRLG